jgi:uroporphyrinogen-III synthase
LAERLRDGGCVVETVIAYRSVPVSDVELSAVLLRAHVLVVGSPHLVRSLAAQGDDALGPAWVALGVTTAEAIRAAGLPLAAVADDPSAPGVAAAIRRALHLTSLD